VIAIANTILRGDTGFGVGKRRRSQECGRKYDAEHSIFLIVIKWRVDSPLSHMGGDELAPGSLGKTLRGAF
jgi:hypothetical protein